MNRSTRLSIASIVLLAALVLGIVSAHQGQGGQGPPPPLDQQFPGPLGMADFGKIISGEFTGDLKRDAVVMDGTQAKMLFAPEVYDTSIPIPTGSPVNDIATLSGLLPYQDYVLTVGYTGLMRHRRNSATSTWESETLYDDTTRWGGAREIAVANFNGDGIPDLVGIGLNGRDVLVEYGNSDGETYTPETTFQALGAPIVTDIWVLNWCEDGIAGTDEIVLNSGAGLQVREPTSEYREGVSWTLAPILGTVIDDDNDGDDQPDAIQRLALVTRVSDVDRFWIYGDTDSEPYFNLGNVGVVSMASGDADHDGDTEVFLNNNTETKFSRLDNQSPLATSFTSTPITKYQFGPPGRHPAYNHAGLAPGDFDSDGELDMLCPAQGDPGPQIIVYSSVDLVRVGASAAAVNAWRPSITQVIFIDDTNELEFHVTRPSTILPDNPGISKTRISVKAFLTPDLGIGTQPSPLHFETRIDLPPEEGGFSWFRMPTLENYSLANSEELFDLVLRQTVYENDGDEPTDGVLDIAPAMTGIFTADPNTITVKTAPETMIWLPAIGTTEPVYGGLDIGPTVPSMDENEEPKDEDPKP